MLPVAMPQGIGPNGEGQEYHEVFEGRIFYQFHTKNGQTRHQQWQEGTMYSTGQRSRNAQSVPIDPKIHLLKVRI